MGRNPTIQELHDRQNFELITELPLEQVKEFVMKQVKKGAVMVRVYMIYQFIMIVTGLVFAGLSVGRFYRGETQSLDFVFYALIFGFTILIVVHELIHGVALKIVGAPKVNFGANLKKFMFFAGADQFVLNRQQFSIVALAPLVAIKVVSLTGILIFLFSPASYFFIILMCLHSLFCAGDIGLLSVFYNEEHSDIYTYDNKAEKKSYYFKKVL